jgi:hypothetical protein
MAAGDTASLVVALSAQLTKFEKDMRAAGIMADKAVNDIEDKFSKINPKISTSFLGNFFANLADKAINAATDAISKLISRFEDLQKTADYAGTSLQWLYGVQAAGAKAGASIDDMNAAVRALAFQLDEMKRGGDNSLKTLLDANPKFLKGANRDALDLADTMRIVGNIIANLDNQVQRVDVAKNLGMPEGAVAALRQGGDAFEKMAKAASAAAPNIDAATEATTKLALAWKEYIKDLGSDWAEKALAGFKKLAAVALAITEWEQSLFHGGPLEEASGRELKRWQEINRVLNETKEKAAAPELKRIVITGGGAFDPFARKKTAAAEDTGAFDRANDQITKRIALTEAETAAVGKGVAVQEQMRTEALLTVAANKQFGEVSAETAEKIKQQADASAKASLAMAEATFKMNQFNSASQQIGSALSTAFADAIVEGKSLNDVLGALLKTLEKAAINAAIMSLFSPGAGGTTPFLSLLGIGKRMAGGPVNSGSPYLVGERGPELMVPNANGMVVPNDALGRGGGGGQVFAPVYQINAAGADTGTVARIQAVLATHARSIEGQARAFASAQSLQATGVAR